MIHNILKNVFGYDHFRPLQEDIIQRTLSGKDSIVIMPTGGGKSLCYQVPALCVDGCAIVVSPLISLMQDQVLSLQQQGVAAKLWNSTLTHTEVQEVEFELVQNRLKLLYVSPERLVLPDFLALLKSCNISFFAIDEAHCISEWGHDFRPPYRQLHQLKTLFPNKPILALTATATEQVTHDIINQLTFTDYKIFKASFNRPNLFYDVKPKKNTFQLLLKFIAERKDQSGIIYCQSRKSVDNITEKLCKNGYAARAYHAGLSSLEREQAQQTFIHDDTAIIVATIAFGMGINKSNVRFVVHYDLPKTVENYYQETGRAGRDGLDSYCLLFFSFADRHKHETFLKDIPDEKERKNCYKKLNQMVDFAAQPRCRRKQLLHYFGEDHSECDCQFCDICKNPPKEVDITLVSQKVLSCIYRVNQNYGVTMIIDILRGQLTPKIKQLRFDQLSTFNIVQDLSKNDLHDVINQLIYLRYILIEGYEYPVLKLSTLAWSFLKEKQPVLMPVYEKPKTAKPTRKKAISGDFDDLLFQKLRDKRKALSTKQNVPAYIIFHDKTLQEIAIAQPQSIDELLSINGIGQKKAQQYGHEFLAVVHEFS